MHAEPDNNRHAICQQQRCARAESGSGGDTDETCDPARRCEATELNWELRPNGRTGGGSGRTDGRTDACTGDARATLGDAGRSADDAEQGGAGQLGASHRVGKPRVAVWGEGTLQTKQCETFVLNRSTSKIHTLI